MADPGSSSLAQALATRVAEARRAAPSVIYVPNLNLWWPGAGMDPAEQPQDVASLLRDLNQVLESLLDDIPDTLPVLLLSTAETAPDQELPPALARLFSHYNEPLELHSSPGQTDIARYVAVYGWCPLSVPDRAERSAFIQSKSVQP